jgi:hypothetical protein
MLERVDWEEDGSKNRKLRRGGRSICAGRNLAGSGKGRLDANCALERETIGVKESRELRMVLVE